MPGGTLLVQWLQDVPHLFWCLVVGLVSVQCGLWQGLPVRVSEQIVRVTNLSILMECKKLQELRKNRRRNQQGVNPVV